MCELHYQNDNTFISNSSIKTHFLDAVIDFSYIIEFSGTSVLMVFTCVNDIPTNANPNPNVDNDITHWGVEINADHGLSHAEIGELVQVKYKIMKSKIKDNDYVINEIVALHD